MCVSERGYESYVQYAARRKKKHVNDTDARIKYYETGNMNHNERQQWRDVQRPSLYTKTNSKPMRYAECRKACVPENKPGYNTNPGCMRYSDACKQQPCRSYKYTCALCRGRRRQVWCVNRTRNVPRPRVSSVRVKPRTGLPSCLAPEPIYRG